MTLLMDVCVYNAKESPFFLWNKMNQSKQENSMLIAQVAPSVAFWGTQSQHRKIIVHLTN